MQTRRVLLATVGVLVLVAVVVIGVALGGGSPSLQATDCSEFTREARKSWQRERVVRPGTAPTLSKRAYWAGPVFADRRAVVSVETPEVRLSGGPFYTTYYERPATGCRSGYLATGDLEPPSGEIVVISDRRTSWLSRSTLQIVNGENGVTVRTPVWPRFRVQLASGETASVIPARGRPAGLGSTRGFIVVLPRTMIRVIGTAFQSGDVELTDAEIRELATKLRQIGS